MKSMLGSNSHLQSPTQDTGVSSSKKIREWKFVTCVFSFTKPTKCTYRILVHSSIDFYHCNMFRHNSAIISEFLHHLSKLPKIRQIEFVTFTYYECNYHVLASFKTWLKNSLKMAQ
jgi:hypothetical protein